MSPARLLPLLLTAGMLAACAADRATDTPWPVLLPNDMILSADLDHIKAAQAEANGLAWRVQRLNARAVLLRRPINDAQAALRRQGGG